MRLKTRLQTIDFEEYDIRGKTESHSFECDFRIDYF